jgi:hypothetical protein
MGILIDITETLVEALHIPHPVLLIHRVLPFSVGLEALCPSRGKSIIKHPSFVFSLPSTTDIFPPSIHRASPSIPRIIIAAFRNWILMVIWDPAFGHVFLLVVPWLI